MTCIGGVTASPFEPASTVVADIVPRQTARATLILVAFFIKTKP